MKKNKSTICLNSLRCVSIKIPIKVALLVLFIINVETVTGQDVNQLRRNTIKLDLTSNLIFRNAFNLSYERVRRPDQTYAITLGYHEFPKLTSLGNAIQTTE